MWSSMGGFMISSDYAPKCAKTNKDLEVSASPTPKESQKAIPSLNPDIKCNFALRQNLKS